MTFGDTHGSESRALGSAEFDLAAKINRLDAKLGKFKDREIDMRLQLEVRVAAIEKPLQNNCARPIPSATSLQTNSIILQHRREPSS
jgi:hypothetical protein